MLSYEKLGAKVSESSGHICLAFLSVVLQLGFDSRSFAKASSEAFSLTTKGLRDLFI